MRFKLRHKSLILKNNTLTTVIPIRYFVLVFVLFTFVNINSALSQSEQNKLVSFNVEDTPVSSALYKLSLQCGFDISYDASDTDLQKHITLNVKDKLAFDIYNEILENTNHAFKQIDKLIVVYKIENNQDEITENNTVLPLPDTVTNQIVPDTVYVSDTIFQTKTDTLLITKTDTLRLVDTVFIVQPGRDKIKQIKKNQNDLITSHVPRRNGWSAELFFSPFASSFSLTEENSMLKFRNFAIGGEISKINNKLNVSVAVSLIHYADNFNNEYLIQEGGYFQTDTVDVYYTITDADTSWYYVTDSTWLPIDDHHYNYNVKNRIGYLNLGLSATYDLVSFGKSRIYSGIGVNSGLLIYRSGTALRDNENEPQGVSFADLEFNKMVFSAKIKLGLKYQINKVTDIKTEVYYYRSFNNVVSDFPYENKFNGLGLKFALVYYF